MNCVLAAESLVFTIKAAYSNSKCEAYIERLEHVARVATKDVEWSNCQAMAASLESLTGTHGGLWTQHRLFTVDQQTRESSPLCTDKKDCPADFKAAWEDMDRSYGDFVGNMYGEYFGSGSTCDKYMELNGPQSHVSLRNRCRADRAAAQQAAPETVFRTAGVEADGISKERKAKEAVQMIDKKVQCLMLRPL